MRARSGTPRASSPTGAVARFFGCRILLLPWACFLRRANGVRPYDFVAVGFVFDLFYSIFKLHSGRDIGYFALGFAYTKYHNAHPRPDTSTLQPVPEPLVGFTKSQGLYVPASI